MTSDSADQTPSEHGQEAPEPTSHEAAAPQPGGESEHREPEQRERYGPLSLLRTRKGDGRALLLFSHPVEEHER
jgi:hypothetical protein